MRSEERFSRNAETDLVCRLLHEKKKLLQVDTVQFSYGDNVWGTVNAYLLIKGYRCPPRSSLFPYTTLSDLTQGKREQFSGFNRTLDAINNVFRKFSAFHDETGRLNVDGMNIISN